MMYEAAALEELISSSCMSSSSACRETSTCGEAEVRCYTKYEDWGMYSV